ncbi:hypothetical protein ABG067_001805 [Albugo candida]
MIYQRFLDDHLESIQNELCLLRNISDDTGVQPEQITTVVLDELATYCEEEKSPSECNINAKNQCIKALARMLIQYCCDIASGEKSTPTVSNRMAMNLTQLATTLNKMVGTYAHEDAASTFIASWVPLAAYAAACICCICIPSTKVHRAQSKSLLVIGEGILQSCENLSTCKNQNEVYSTFLTQLLSLVSQNTSKEEWILPQSLPKLVLRWMVSKVSFPNLGGDVLGRLLALVFPLVDACNRTTQLVGIEILYHIIKNVTATELRWYSDILLQVLRRAITTRTPAVLDLALASLISALELLQIPSQSFDLYDQFFPRLINDANLAIEHEIRLLLLRSIRKMLTAMGAPQSIHLIVYLQPLLEVTLRTFDSTNTALVSEALLLLKDIISSAWPRITYHTEDIFVGVLRSVAYCATLSAEGMHAGRDHTLTLLPLGHSIIQSLHALEKFADIHGQEKKKILTLLGKTQKAIRKNCFLYKFCSDAIEVLQAQDPQSLSSAPL